MPQRLVPSLLLLLLLLLLLRKRLDHHRRASQRGVCWLRTPAGASPGCPESQSHPGEAADSSKRLDGATAPRLGPASRHKHRVL
jgi:hypothetical protein